MAYQNTTNNKLFLAITFMLFSFATPLVHADEKHTMPVLELDRSILLSYTQNQRSNAWLSYRVFDKGFDFLNYASKTGTTTKLEQWTSVRGGFNAHLDENLRLRLYLESGSQQLTRPIEPKQLNPKYWGGDLRLQWSQHINRTLHWGLAAGYRMHKAPTSSATKLQQGTIFATAAPGKTLFDSTSKDDGWLVTALTSYQATENLTLHANAEYRSIQVQSSTTSQDPLIQALLVRQQVPQTTPWKEKHFIVGAGMDWQVFNQLLLSMDIRHYTISRSNYIPRRGFVDYNQNTQFDGYLSYHTQQSWSVFLHGQAASHFVLGDLPLLYNRRNNHTFKNPFGFLALGVQYKH